MLDLCRQKIRIASATPNTVALGMPSRANHIGDMTAAISAASDEILKIRATTNHVKQAAMPAGQNRAKRVPRNVATPLPPLKLR